MSGLELAVIVLFGLAVLVGIIAAFVVIRGEFRRRVGLAKLRAFARRRPVPPRAKYEQDDTRY